MAMAAATEVYTFTSIKVQGEILETEIGKMNGEFIVLSMITIKTSSPQCVSTPPLLVSWITFEASSHN